jgi:hypothetical protein
MGGPKGKICQNDPLPVAKMIWSFKYARDHGFLRFFFVIVLLGENGSPCCTKASFKLEVIKSPLSGKSKIEFCFGNKLGAIIKYVI